jgi:hypothetical protein
MRLKAIADHVIGANIVDFGASPSASAATNTTAINAAIAAGLQYYGGAVYVPSGGFSHNALTVPATYTGGLRLYGESKIASRLTFVPTADNQVGFTVDRLAGGAIANDNYSGVTIERLTFRTDDTSYHKTGVKLVDCGQTVLRDVNIYGYTGTAKNAVGLHTQGRESCSATGLHITACVPIYIGKNPDLTDGWLSADHFHFSDCYLSVVGTPSTLVSAAVLVEDGVHCSQLEFDGYQAWVGGVHGLYWNQTVAPYAAPTNLSIANMRSEQGTSATGYSVYVNMHATYPLYNLTMTNCEFDVGREGVYTRNVIDQVWTSILAKHPSPRTVMDVGTARSVTWKGVSTSSTASTSAIITDSNLYLAEAAPHWQGQVLPTNATWVKRTTASTYNERPSREMSAHKWYWSGTLADGVSNGATGDGSATLIPCNSDINSWVHAEVKVIATIAGSNILEYGIWYISPITGLTNGVVKASGSTNTASTDIDANLCVFCNGASPMYQQMVVRNRLGASAVVTIEVTGKRSVET